MTTKTILWISSIALVLAIIALVLAFLVEWMTASPWILINVGAAILAMVASIMLIVAVRNGRFIPKA